MTINYSVFQGQPIIDMVSEMDRYISLILKARTKAGFNSLKYPLLQVYINKRFLPEIKEIIAKECNLIGWMSEFPPICTHEDDLFKTNEFIVETEDDMVVKLVTVKTPHQDNLYEKRLKEREEIEIRKSKENMV